MEEEEKAAADAADMRKSLQTSAVGKDGQAVEEWDYLNNLFKRYNKVISPLTPLRRQMWARQSAVHADRLLLRSYSCRFRCTGIA